MAIALTDWYRRLHRPSCSVPHLFDPPSVFTSPTELQSRPSHPMIAATRSEQLADIPQQQQPQPRSGSKRPCPQTFVAEDFVVTWETSCAARVTVQSNNCSIVLEGCGTIEKLTEYQQKKDSDACQGMQLQGYTLVKGQCLAFDSPSWASRWATLSNCQAGDVVRLVSQQPMEESESNRNHNMLPSFRVHHPLHDHPETTRPTVYPTSWKLAVAAIVQDVRRRVPRRTEIQEGNGDDNDDGVNDIPPASCAFYASDSESDNGANEYDGDDVMGSSSDQKVVIAFCGAKNVGKSTCLHYCSNQLLSVAALSNDKNRPTIAVLDADPGQPLYGQPGQLQLSAVSSPTDLTQNGRGRCLECHYYGSTTSETDPSMYLRCIDNLVCTFREDSSVDVLLVNMDGWVKGLGMQILTTLLQTILRPDHVIGLVGDTAAKSLEVAHILPSTAVIHSCRAYGTDQQEVQQQGVVEDDRIAADVQRRSPPGMRSAVLRSIRLVSYFVGEQLATKWFGHSVVVTSTGLSDPQSYIAHHLASVRPRVVSFDDVQVKFCDESITLSKEKVLMALNGSLVGLCCGGQPNDVSSACLHSCVGLGLVRSVDTTARLLFIITPPSVQLDTSVNVLGVGSGIRLPVECYHRGVHSARFPFLAMDDHRAFDVLGSETMKSRHGIGRRGLR